MTVTVEAPVNTKCTAHKCKHNCTEYVPKLQIGFYECCVNCTHTAYMHGIRPKPKTAESDPVSTDPVKDSSPIVYKDEPKPVKAKPAAVTAANTSTGYGAADTRAALVRNGVTVGKRGRMSPEQWSKGAELIAAGK